MKLHRGIISTKVTEATDDEWEWLDVHLSFKNKKARYSSTETEVKSFLERVSGNFPSGLLPLVIAGAPENDPPIEIEVVDQRPTAPAPMSADLSWLYDFQEFGVKRLLKSEIGIAQLPTGSGKTEIIVGLMKCVPCNWVVCVPDISLLGQTADRWTKRTGLPCGRVGDEEFTTDRITVASFQTLYKRYHDPAVRKLMREAQGVIFDECFVAGTLVGDKPIDQVQIGDLVPSYDETRGALVQRRVTRLWRKKPLRLMKVQVGDRVLVCTPNHPFLTKRGWVSAERLLVWKDELCLSSKPGSEDENAARKLCGVQSGFYDHDKVGTGSLQQRRSELLYQGVHDEGEGAQAIRYVNEDGTEVRYASQRENENQQPNERSCCAREAKDDASCDGLEAPYSGRQWTRTERSAIPSRLCVGVVDGGLHRNRLSHTEGSTQELQDRHRERDLEDRDRGRRGESSQREGSFGGQEEGEVLSWSRVDSLTFLEPGSDGTFGGLCPDGLVYNLEVEGTHTYLADGVVVHNCHTVPANTFFLVAQGFVNAYYRFGFSATPLERGDKKTAYLYGVTGPVVYKVPAKWLEQQKRIARPLVRFVTVIQEVEPVYYTPTEFLTAKKLHAMSYDRFIVESEKRNLAIIDVLKRARRPGLVFVKLKEHGYKLHEAAARQGIKTLFLKGQHSTKARKGTLTMLTRGDLDFVIATDIFRQGLDVQELQSVIRADAGSSVIQSLQKGGRGSRVIRDEDTGDLLKKDFELWDILDRGHPWFLSQSQARMRAWKKEGYLPAIEKGGVFAQMLLDDLLL